MKRLNRILILTIILLSGTQIINIPMINLSLFQIAIIIFGFFFILELLVMQKIKSGSYLILFFLFLISSFLAFYLSINRGWAKSNLLLGLMTSILILAIPINFSKDDIPLLCKYLIRSQYIVIPFSIYSMVMFYFYDGLPKIINLPFNMTILLDDFYLLRTRAGSQIRLVLPYATPPVLSLVMAVCIVILFIKKDLFKKSIRYILILIYSIILIFTGSRTGIVALVLTLALYFIKDMHIKHLTKKNIANILMVILFILCAILVLNKSDITYFNKLLYRFKNVNIFTDRHFLIPLDGLIIWTSSFKNFILGIGFGSSYFIKGAHTILPPYFLNSFVTLIVERGLLGVLIDIYLLYLLIKIGKYIKKGNNEMKPLYYSYICILISCLTYEVLNSYFVIFIIAILCITIDEKERDKDESFNNSTNL